MTRYAEKLTAITGIGMSDISRGAGVSALSLTIDAALEAISDAGLSREDIDGMATWPGERGDGSGFSDVGIPALQDALRLKLGWYSNASETAGQFGALFNAIGAIAAGYCRHVLVFRTMYEASARKTGFANALNRPGDRVFGPFSWFAPYHAYAPVLQQALMFNLYTHRSGMTDEQRAWIAITQRDNAALNPRAVFRDPITVDDFMASPVLCTPVRMLDCDVHIDGAAAVVLSHVDAARDLPKPLTRIEAVGTSMRYRNSWTQLEPFDIQCQPLVAEDMWNRTDLTIKDVDMGQLYNGFSFHTINWLENLGVCDRYGAKDFIDGGRNIARDGVFPINTDGGAMSAGRMHAYGQVHEAVTQLRGDGGERQVPGDPRVAVMTTAGGPLAGAFLLVRE
ncbi:MAG: thiolase family protein [Blastomonas sp.]